MYFNPQPDWKGFILNWRSLQGIIYLYIPDMPASRIASNYPLNERWAPLAVNGTRAPLRRKLRGQPKLTRKAQMLPKCCVWTNYVVSFEGVMNQTYRKKPGWRDVLFLQLLLQMPTMAVNRSSIYGEGPLHVACQEKQAECVQLLLEKGADPDISSSYKFPIHCAVEANSIRSKETVLYVMLGLHEKRLLINPENKIIWNQHWMNIFNL